MDDRPEYVKCVADVTGPSIPFGEHRISQRSVCGRHIGSEFHFVSWGHADAAVAQSSRLTVCPECVAKRQQVA
ncbi:hypothetical protein [Gemmata sp.]|uniref:hypothetical protein n=1 Tax=Gemmata sp. TaxID=1914242 RepID=UPI003F72F230